MKPVKEIRFKVDHDATLLNPDHSFAANVKGVKEQTWTLGLGPCGREVSALEYEICLYALTIKQTSYPVGFLKAQDDAMQVIRMEPKGPRREEIIAGYYKLLEDVKVELFVYPLDTIRGRIRAAL